MLEHQSSSGVGVVVSFKNLKKGENKFHGVIQAIMTILLSFYKLMREHRTLCSGVNLGRIIVVALAPVCTVSEHLIAPCSGGRSCALTVSIYTQSTMPHGIPFPAGTLGPRDRGQWLADWPFTSYHSLFCPEFSLGSRQWRASAQCMSWYG